MADKKVLNDDNLENVAGGIGGHAIIEAGRDANIQDYSQIHHTQVEGDYTPGVKVDSDVTTNVKNSLF